MSGLSKFVVFPLGNRRFAVSAKQVSELASPGQVQSFPHTTPSLKGVLVRRGSVVAVCDISPELVGTEMSEEKFYLIVHCHIGGMRQPIAVPVTGECILADAMVTNDTGEGQFSLGTLLLDGETVSIVDVEKLVAYCTDASPVRGMEIGR